VAAGVLLAHRDAVERRAAERVEDEQLWCAAMARPDSLTITGCSISRALQTLAMR